MNKYKVIQEFYLNGELKEVGSTIELNEEIVRLMNLKDKVDLLGEVKEKTPKSVKKVSKKETAKRTYKTRVMKAQ